jgi:hypothetical protein
MIHAMHTGHSGSDDLLTRIACSGMRHAPCAMRQQRTTRQSKADFPDSPDAEKQKALAKEGFPFYYNF